MCIQIDIVGLSGALCGCYFRSVNKGLALATENVNRAVSVDPLCTLSMQTLAIPDVDIKLKFSD